MKTALFVKAASGGQTSVLAATLAAWISVQPSVGDKVPAMPVDLQVTVVGAEGLPNVDGWAAGKSDPYVVVEVRGKQGVSFKTPVVDNNLNPTWNHRGEIHGFTDGDILEFQVWDSNAVKRDKLMGTAALASQDILPYGLVDQVQLPLSGDGATGSIRVQVGIARLVAQASEAATSSITDATATNISLTIQVVKASGLINVDGLTPGLMSSFCKVFVPGKPGASAQTSTIVNSLDPEWNHTVDLTGIQALDVLNFEIWDSSTVSRSEKMLCKSVLPVRDFLAYGGAEGELPLRTESDKEVGALEVTIYVAGGNSAPTLAVPADASASAQPVAVMIERARELVNVDGLAAGISDPYCVCHVAGRRNQQLRTPTVSNSLTPEWNYTGELPSVSPQDTLEFEVYDKNVISGDRFLGRAVVAAEDFWVHGGAEGEMSLADASGNAAGVIAIKIQIGSVPGATPAVAQPDMASTVSASNKLIVTLASASLPISTFNPFCVCSIARKPTESVITKDVKQTADPVWNHTGEFSSFLESDTLEFTVWGASDRSGESTLIGRTRLATTEFMVYGGAEGELALSDDAGNDAGALKVTIIVAPVETVVVATPSVAERAVPAQDIAAGKTVSPGPVSAAVSSYIPQPPVSSAAATGGLVGAANAKSSPAVASASSGGLAQALQVALVSAQGLRDADWGSGRSDPYCSCEIAGHPHSRIQTQIVNDSVNPVWNYEGTLVGFTGSESLVFRILDKDPLKSDDTLGTVTLPSSSFLPSGFSGDLLLDQAGKSSMATLRVRVSAPGAGAGTAAPTPVSQQQGCPSPAAPYVQQATPPRGPAGANASGMTLPGVTPAALAATGAATPVGRTSVASVASSTAAAAAAGASGATPVARMSTASGTRPSAIPSAIPMAAADPSALRILVQSGQGLKEPLSGVSESYCTLEMSGHSYSRVQTKTVNKTSNPVWQQEMVISPYVQGASLVIKVWDRSTGREDECVGVVTLLGRQFHPYGCQGEFSLDAESKKLRAKLSLKIHPMDSLGGAQVSNRSGRSVPADASSGPSAVFSATRSPLVRNISANFPGGMAATPVSFPGQSTLSGNGAHSVKVMVCGARYLRDADNVFLGHMNSYCAFEVYGRPQTKRRTVGIRGTQNPQWNHEADIQGLLDGDSLFFAVYESAASNAGQDELLGEVMLKSTDFLPRGFDGEVYLTREGAHSRASLIIRIIVMDTTVSHDWQARQHPSIEADMDPNRIHKISEDPHGLCTMGRVLYQRPVSREEAMRDGHLVSDVNAHACAGNSLLPPRHDVAMDKLNNVLTTMRGATHVNVVNGYPSWQGPSPTAGGAHELSASYSTVLDPSQQTPKNVTHSPTAMYSNRAAAQAARPVGYISSTNLIRCEAPATVVVGAHQRPRSLEPPVQRVSTMPYRPASPARARTPMQAMKVHSTGRLPVVPVVLGTAAPPPQIIAKMQPVVSPPAGGAVSAKMVPASPVNGRMSVPMPLAGVPLVAPPGRRAAASPTPAAVRAKSATGQRSVPNPSPRPSPLQSPVPTQRIPAPPVVAAAAAAVPMMRNSLGAVAVARPVHR